MMSEKPLRCLLRRILWLVRLCGDQVAYEKCDGLRKEVEKAVARELFTLEVDPISRTEQVKL